MPLRPALGAGGGAAAWESAGGFFQADAAEVIQAGDAFMFLSRETDLGGQPAFVFDTTVTITQDLLHIYNNTLLRLTVEPDGNLIPGQGTTHGGFDLGKFGTALGIFRDNADSMKWSAAYVSLLATAATGYIDFWADSKHFMRMKENHLTLGQATAIRGYLILSRDSTGVKCGIVQFQDELGVGGWLFKDQLHNLRFHTAEPGTDDTVGAGIRTNVFGNLYTAGGAGSQNLTVAHSNYKCTQLASDGSEFGGITRSAANNRITVAVEGIYRISFDMSFTASLAGIYTVYVVRNGAGLTGTKAKVKVLNNGDMMQVAMHTCRGVPAGQYLEIWLSSDQTNPAFVVKECNFTVDLLERN